MADNKYTLENILVENLKNLKRAWSTPQDTFPRKIREVLPPSLSHSECLTFASSLTDLEECLRRQASIIMLLSSTWEQLDPTLKKLIEENHRMSTSLYLIPSVQEAMVSVLPFFDTSKSKFDDICGPNGIHPLAQISPSARLGQNVRVGPFAVIGKNCVIEENSIIGPHCVIENDVKIGAHTLLHSSIFIGARSQIGQFCVIHPHTSIGADGFGFLPQKNGIPQKIPQLGFVSIGNHVEIGSNCAIDRATLHATVIGQGTKLDNFVHIAHNCQIGENGLIAAGFMMAGSSKIGNHFMTGGNSVVTSHVQITDHVTLAGRSTVTKNISLPGAYGGYPLQPLKEALKTIANLGQLTEMRKTLNKISKFLKIEE